jgi:hypothetical protein
MICSVRAISSANLNFLLRMRYLIDKGKNSSIKNLHKLSYTAAAFHLKSIYESPRVY